MNCHKAMRGAFWVASFSTILAAPLIRNAVKGGRY
jgi:hypothetical protein